MHVIYIIVTNHCEKFSDFRMNLILLIKNWERRTVLGILKQNQEHFIFALT